MYKTLKSFIYPIWTDFKKYSFMYRFWYNKIYVPSCKRKLNKYIKEDRCVSLYIGLPRSGKTTFIAYLTHLCNVCNYPVYCNVPVLGAKPFSKEDIGKYDMTNGGKGGMILLDEAGIIYDNRLSMSRDEKAFTEEALTFLKLIGHYHSHVCLFSQSMDIDVKWVRMSKDIFFVKRSLIFGFTSIYRVRRKLDVNPDTHKIEDFYDKEDGLIHRLFHFRFRRKPYYHLFDSYSAPPLKPFPNTKKYQPYQFNNDVHTAQLKQKIASDIQDIRIRKKERGTI